MAYDPEVEVEFSDEVLEETPERVTTFLVGIAALPEVETLLDEEGGMKEEDRDLGRALLTECTKRPLPTKPTPDTPTAKEQRKAEALLDSKDEPTFQKAKAALRHNYPEQYGYIFHNLTASQGHQAVLGIATFCSRYRALYDGSDPSREKSKAEDKKAIERLIDRKITLDDIKEFERLVEIALGKKQGAPDPTPVFIDVDALKQERRKILSKLKIWFDEWAGIARAVVKKHVYRIRLGLEQRRSPTKNPPGGGNPK